MSENQPEKAEQEDLISLANAANQMGIKRATIYYYMNDLGIEGKRYGRDKKKYISQEELARLKEYKNRPWRIVSPKETKQGEHSKEESLLWV